MYISIVSNVLGHTGQHCPSGVTGLGQGGRAHSTVLQSRAQVGQPQGSSGSGGMMSWQSAGRMQGLSGQITGPGRAPSCAADDMHAIILQLLSCTDGLTHI